MFALADCNNFFASCERVFRPELNGKPVVVLSSNDGCIVARSNEAKALGIPMGAPYFKIKNIIEHNGVAVFSNNFALYGDMSQRVQAVLRESAPSMEVYSIDEAFLDLRGIHADFDAYAKALSAKCWRYTSIPVSVGVAPTKTLAKIASKLCKQYPKLRGGCYMYRPQDIEKVLRAFPVADVWGIGRQSAKKLSGMGIGTAWDYAQLPEATVRKLFALPGWRTWQELRGTPCIEFEDLVQARQSICISRSFVHEITDLSELCTQTANFAEGVVSKIRQQKSLCLEMAVFAFTNRFKENAPQTYGSHLVTFSEGTAHHATFVQAAVAATRELFRPGFGYKKAGVVATRLTPMMGSTPSLFCPPETLARQERLSATLDTLNATFGRGTVRFGVQGDGSIKLAREHQSPHYTTRWEELPKVSVK